LKIIGITDSNGAKPAIDAGWDEVSNSNIGNRFLDVNADATLVNLIVTHGNAGPTEGGAILVEGINAKLVIRNCIICKSRANQGSAISMNSGATVVVRDSILHSNRGYGTIRVHDSSTTLYISSTFLYNNIESDGNIPMSGGSRALSFDEMNQPDIFFRVNMDDVDFQSIHSAPTPKSCSYSNTLCADAGLPGTTCTDRSPASLGVWCNTSTTKAPANAETSNGIHLHSNTRVFFMVLFVWIGLH
jgi:hypothetical protein